MRIGTYAVERDYSQYVQNASDIVLAVVGTATKGPINKPVLCSSPAEFVNTFGRLNPNCLGGYSAYYFLNQGSRLWYVRAASSSAKKATVSVAGTDASNVAVADAIVMEALNEGTHFNDYTLTIEAVSGTETYNIVLKNTAGATVESKTGVLLEELSTIKFNNINFVSKSETATKLTADTYVFSAGDDGISDITSKEYIGAGKMLSNDNIDMNLLAVPGVSDINVISEMIVLVENRGDCLYIIDPPNQLDPAVVADWHNGSGEYNHTKFNTTYGAIYYAWQRIYDSQNGIYVEVPPSTIVAPTIARSAAMSEIWQAPAGLSRGRVLGVNAPVYSPSTAEMNMLYSDTNNINCIVEDPQVGLCIFGQKTLSRENTALNRVNVRMLMNYLKRVVVNACRNLVFEPNDRITWNRFEDLVTPILDRIQSGRGIYEYQVVKGNLVVTDEDIDNYRMPCKILVRPTKSAEEIPIYFTLTSTGADFNDVLSNDGINLE